MAPEIVTTERHIRRDRKTDFRDFLVGRPSSSTSMFIAFSIAAAFPRHTPHWKDLCDRFGMNRATAYRYLAAMKAVRGEV